jgi:predicted DCC family thiol-disulfide oxidoreductase YuxK
MAPILLFDGVCNFCNGAVNFVIKRNKKKNIRFAPLQSSMGNSLLNDYNLPADNLETFFFIEDNKPYAYSTAALRVCRHLSGLWPLLYVFIIVPAFIRDGVYKWIGKNRYKWFGKKESCMIPSPDVRARFLS